jgi:hypothetical protein
MRLSLYPLSSRRWAAWCGCGLAAIGATASAQATMILSHRGAAAEAWMSPTAGGLQTSLSYGQRGGFAPWVVPRALAQTGGAAAYRLRVGPRGQHIEAVQLELRFADSSTVVLTELTARPLRAEEMLDDGSRRRLGAAWARATVLGPVLAPTPSGELRALAVVEDTAAEVSLPYGGRTARLQLLVADSIEEYGDWLSNYFSAAEIANDPSLAPAVSHTGDGVANAIKYALGLSPRVALAEIPWTIDLHQGRLRIQFSHAARPDIQLLVMVGATPEAAGQLWSAIGASEPAGAVTVLDNASPAPGAPRFMRLEVAF